MKIQEIGVIGINFKKKQLLLSATNLITKLK